MDFDVSVYDVCRHSVGDCLISKPFLCCYL